MGFLTLKKDNICAQKKTGGGADLGFKIRPVIEWNDSGMENSMLNMRLSSEGTICSCIAAEW